MSAFHQARDRLRPGPHPVERHHAAISQTQDRFQVEHRTQERLSLADHLPEPFRGGVIALGNFDGVHLGHQAVIGRAIGRAAHERRPTLVATFAPHPTCYFRADAPPFALTNLGSARTVADIVLASLDDPNFGRLYRETLLRERREALLHVLTEARRRGQIRAGADLVVAVDTVFGAIHHRLLLTKDHIDGPFVTALCDLLLSGLTP